MKLLLLTGKHYLKYFCLIIITLFNLQIKAQDKVIDGKPRLYNPILADNIADPSIVYFDDTYYLYGTTDINKDLNRAGEPVVWKSRDFVNWHFEGILKTGIDWNKAYSYLDKDGKEKSGYYRYWAPGKVLKKNGRYYLFVTIVKPNDNHCTYVLLADRPEGPFFFPNGKGIEENKPVINDIDGEPFVDDNGKAYVYWRRRKASALSDDLLSLKGDSVIIPTTHKDYSEGPGLFKRGNIYYYFYTQSGHASYSNGYMMSKVSPLGPFEAPKSENIFISSSIKNDVWGPGHGNVFHLPGTDKYYFVYLEYGEGGTTRQVYVNEMHFNPDGTIIPVVPTQEGVGFIPASKPDLRQRITDHILVTASSYEEPRIVKGDIAPNPDLKLLNNDLKAEHLQRISDYKPENANDNTYRTSWKAAINDKDPWIMYDLGGIKDIAACEMFFLRPTFGQAWKLEKSDDGKNWKVCGEQSALAIRSPQQANHIGKARFIRLHITKGEPGLWEFKIYLL